MKLEENKKKVLYISVGILLLLILYALKNTSYFMRAFTFIFSIVLFFMGDTLLKLNFKGKHYIIFFVIATSGILLSPLYFISINYDKILHFVNPFLLGFLVYFLVNKTKLEFSTKLFITFSVVLSSLALFEIVEFAIDQFFNFQLQGVFIRDITGIAKLKIIMNKNDDTMIDLIFGAAGIFIFTLYKRIEIFYKKLSSKKKK